MLPANTILQNRYRVVRLLKAGGMGEVYEAIDQNVNRILALKRLTIISPTPDELRAFKREAELLANLKHPALPWVGDHFNEQQSQFLVMEFVAGPDLDDILHAQGKPFSVNVVLRWADQLLDALVYLHNQQPPILHRDIKPQNLKVTGRDQIMLLDFGIAKGSVGLQATNANLSIFGYTPGYAPLEQMQGVGTSERSDLYALGATLYHLLTNITPTDALSRAAAQIQGQPDPLRPAHTVNPAVPLALSTILMDALALDYNKRPASAAILRQKMQTIPTIAPPVATPPASASSAGQPTILPTVAVAPQPTVRVAPPPPAVAPPTMPTIAGQPTARVKPLVARRWWLWLVGLVLITGVVGGMLYWFNLPPISLLFDSSTATSLVIPSNPEKMVSLATLTGHTDAVYSVAWSPDGTTLASTSADTTVRLWNANGTFIKELTGHTEGIHSVAWSPDGATLASPSGDGTVRLWNADGTFIKELTGHTGSVYFVAWSPDGATLASASGDTTVLLWSADGTFIKELIGHTNSVRSVAWSPDGATLASTSVDTTVRLWSADGTFIKALTGHTSLVHSVAWSPDGATLASASHDKTVRLWGVK